MQALDNQELVFDSQVAAKLAQIKNLSVDKRTEILKNIASFMAGLEIGQNLNPEGDKKNEN